MPGTKYSNIWPTGALFLFKLDAWRLCCISFYLRKMLVITKWLTQEIYDVLNIYTAPQNDRPRSQINLMTSHITHLHRTIYIKVKINQISPIIYNIRPPTTTILGQSR
jgi:hypothetical protein